MVYIAIIIICVLFLILMKYIFGFKYKDLKTMDEKFINKELDSVTCELPEDTVICKEILKKLNNENVIIKKDDDYNNSLYTVFNNTITIGKFKSDYIRIQTIAHECIHSTQNKKLLWFNFIFTNIYMLYFIIISILTLFGIINNYTIPIFTLAIFAFIHYSVRSYLENDAMIKAKYIAIEYMDKTKKLNKEKISKIVNKYDEINKIGIPATNYMLIFNNIFKIIFYCFILLIK